MVPEQLKNICGIRTGSNTAKALLSYCDFTIKHEEDDAAHRLDQDVFPTSLVAQDLRTKSLFLLHQAEFEKVSNRVSDQQSEVLHRMMTGTGPSFGVLAHTP